MAFGNLQKAILYIVKVSITFYKLFTFLASFDFKLLALFL